MIYFGHFFDKNFGTSLIRFLVTSFLNEVGGPAETT